jgi:hypothetical protein
VATFTVGPSAPTMMRAVRDPLWTGAPEVVQALGLRLQYWMWEDGGRGWALLRDTLLSCLPPHSAAGRALVIARAACIRDVCAIEGAKGVELIYGVQV